MKRSIYTEQFIAQVAAADQTLIGVRLAQQCIRHKIPVPVVAEKIKVSKPTVYHWFTGKTKPIAALLDKMEKLVATLESAQTE